MWQSLSALCPLPWWHQLVSSAIDDIITQLGKEKEGESKHNEFCTDELCDSHESDENPSVESDDLYDEDDDFEKFEFEYRQMHGNDAFQKLGLP